VPAGRLATARHLDKRAPLGKMAWRSGL